MRLVYTQLRYSVSIDSEAASTCAWEDQLVEWIRAQLVLAEAASYHQDQSPSLNRKMPFGDVDGRDCWETEQINSPYLYSSGKRQELAVKAFE